MGLPSNLGGIHYLFGLTPLFLLRINEMIKTTQSILLIAILAASGFASAQTPATGAAGTERKLGTGELAKPNASETMKGNTSGVTRAEVKSEVGTAERKLGTGETAKSGVTGSTATQGNTSGTTRAEVKADAKSEPRKLGTGEEVKSGSASATSEVAKSGSGSATSEAAKSGSAKASSEERKRMRAERRAKAKAKRDAMKKSGN